MKQKKQDKTDKKKEQPEQKDDIQTLNLSNLEDKIKLNFDYEMNNARLIMDNTNIEKSKILYYDDFRKEYISINYDSFFDKLKPLPKLPDKNKTKGNIDTNEFDDDFEEMEEPDKIDDIEKANLFKRLVSKKKRRFQDSQFDLICPI